MCYLGSHSSVPRRLCGLLLLPQLLGVCYLCSVLCGRILSLLVRLRCCSVCSLMRLVRMMMRI